MRVFSRGELAERASLLSAHKFCQHPADLAFAKLDRLRPRETITTIDWSEKHRIIRKPDGEKANWSRALTPFMVPIMDALDDPEVLEIVVPKPSRCGGTMVAENHAVKRLDFGPSGDIMWYLAGPEEVRSYAERVFKPIFEDHIGVSSRIGSSPSDNKKTMKRVGSQTIELMVMSGKTTTNRQAAFIVFDEPDSYHRDYRSNFLEQGRQRQRMLGNDRKIYACAHADIGWSGGIGAAWVLSTQGIFTMRCPQCGGYGSPYPTKYWPDVPRFRLAYTKAAEGAPVDRRLALAEQTACIACPHNGCALDEKQRVRMVEEGAYMHKGQALDIKAGIVGNPDKNRTWGFWVHVLMSQQVGLGDLARELEGAIEHRERTGKSDKIKQVMVRTFGEVFEGIGDLKGLDAKSLKDRTSALANIEVDEGMVNYVLGEVPDGVLFVTAAVDVGGDKFDVMIVGWDMDRRRYVIDRFTLKQRLHRDGVWRQLAPTKVQRDWDVLIEQVIDRRLPLQSDNDVMLPVAVTVIDIKDGNATPFGVEFLRQVSKKRWLAWPKVYGIMGAKSKDAPEIAVSGKDYNVGSDGKKIEPGIKVYNVGSWKLKSDSVDTLAISDGSAGQWVFPINFPDRAYDEFFNEVLVDKEWVRNGPNESLDLGGYNEAARQILKPTRKEIKWNNPNTRPVWARPVPLHPEGGDPAGLGREPVAGVNGDATIAAKPKSLLARFDGLNGRGPR